MLRALSALLGLSILASAVPARADGRAESMAHFRRANSALLAGQPDVARVELLNAIKADPTNGAAHLMQGLAYLRLGDGIAAEAEIRRARETGIDASATRHLMGEALLLQGAAQRALDETEPAGVAPRYAAWAARIRGQALVQTGDPAAAAASFASAIRLGPGDPEVWTDVGRFRSMNGDALGALQAADRAVALAPNNLAAVILKGELTRTQLGLVAALPWFDRALGIDPQNVAAMLEKAATLGEMGRTRDMLAITREVIALDGRNPVAFYLQAVLAARARNFPLARTLMRHTGGSMDNVPAVMLLQASIDYQNGNNEQAIGRLVRLVAMQSDNLKARRILAAAQFRAADYSGTIGTLRPIADGPQADSYVLTLIGRALERQGDRDAAAAYLDRAALPLPPERPATNLAVIVDLRRTLAGDPGDRDARAALARALLAGGDVAGGLAEATTVLNASPADPVGLLVMGDALAAQGQYRGAADAYRRAASVSFTEPVALRMIDALRQAGDGPGAYQTLAIFLAQNPQNVAARLIAADLAMASGQWPRAVEILEGLRRRLGNRDAAILNNLAWAYHRTGRPARALPLAAAAYAMVPANPAVANTYGWLLLATKADPRRGLALLEQSAAQAPANPGVRWHLAQAYATLGRPAEARTEAEAALALPGLVERAAATALLARL
jgi:tetratricopeptide (TPR) repeat protein